ncbi:MAG TPA: pitrilysin family protein [Candidatus Eremiobacteraceae bacterium]|nr:pitrilysin family protein [Candidatus Eremiobacteraceae bacterium]
MNDGAIQKSVLDNGIRVITERVSYVRSVAMGVWVSVGSSNEEAGQRGISHCIEHMLFKGTRTRTAREIAELMDSIGGHLNAFTDKETTCFHARTVDEHAPLAVEILADMLENSAIDPAELHKEQQVILEEIKMYDDSPDEVSQDIFVRSAWGGSPLGEPTIGYASTVSALTRDALLDYMGHNYVPGNVIVTAVGNLEHDDFVADVRRRFGGLAGVSQHADPKPPVFRPVSVVKQRDCEQVYVLVGAEGTSAGDDRRYIYSVLDTILGGGMASRLFQEIREKRGLVYSVYSAHQMYRSGGLFTIAAATRPKNAQEVLSLIRAETTSLAERGVSPDEVARAKEHLKGGLLLSLESTSTRMLRLGRTELVSGRSVPPSEVVEKIESVTKEQVDAAARSLFAQGKLALTVLGPVDDRFEAQVGLAESA